MLNEGPNLTTLYPTGAGLFKRAILMSGSALSPWAAVQEPVYYAVQAARQLGCDVPDDLYRHYETLLHCLRDRTVDQILQVHIFPLCESVCNRQHKSKVAGSDRIRIDLLEICMNACPFVW